MSNVFQSLVNLFEILAIGVFAIGILMYIMMTYHPLLYFVLKYATSLANAIKISIKELEIWYAQTPKTATLIEPEGESEKQNKRPLLGFGEFHPFTILQFFGFLGFLYFSGSIANIATYSFLRTSDEKIVGWLYEAAKNQTGIKTLLKTSTGKDSLLALDFNEEKIGDNIKIFPIQQIDIKPDSGFQEYCWLPIKSFFSPLSRYISTDAMQKHHIEMILTQSRVRTFHPEANSELLKFVRLERAFVLFSFLLTFFAFIKIFCLLFIRILYYFVKSKKNIEWKLDFGFLSFLDYRRYQRSRLFAIRNFSEKERDELAHNVDWTEMHEEGDPNFASHQYALHKFVVGMKSHIATFIVSGISYIIAMKLWYEVSVFYHVNIIGIYMQGK